MTKMTDAFKKVFLGLGGDPKKLAENNDVGDYIVDLESAIKDYVNEAATHELPTPEAEDIGKIVSVVSDGDTGAEYALDAVPNELPTPASTNVGKVATVVSDGSGGYEWGAETVDGLPSVTSDDYMKVLKVGLGNTWQKLYYNPIEVYATYFGTLDLVFPSGIDRLHFVQDKFLKGLEFNGRSADFSKGYNGHIPCIGYAPGKRAYFKGIIDETGTGTGAAEIYIVIDANSSSGDSITITPIA